jgi:hypothetical protein
MHRVGWKIGAARTPCCCLWASLMVTEETVPSACRRHGRRHPGERGHVLALLRRAVRAGREGVARYRGGGVHGSPMGCVLPPACNRNAYSRGHGVPQPLNSANHLATAVQAWRQSTRSSWGRTWCLRKGMGRRLTTRRRRCLPLWNACVIVLLTADMTS